MTRHVIALLHVILLCIIIIFVVVLLFISNTRGLFHKTSLPNKPGLFQLFGLIVKCFGSSKQIYYSSSSVTLATYAWKLTWGRLTVRLSLRSSNTEHYQLR